MDFGIFLLLLQDGVTSGAIYLLLAVGLLLVFSVTRVIFIPQGDLVAYGALSMAGLLGGHVPGTVWLVDGGAVVVAVVVGRSWRGVAWALGPAGVLTGVAEGAVRVGAPGWVMGGVTVATTALLGPLLYRFAFRPLGRASLLTLLIVAMAVHYVLLGVGLVTFGPEAVRIPAFSEGSVVVGGVEVSGQSLWVVGVCAALVVGLWWMFRRTGLGRALRATASNPLGARLMGIESAATGGFAFLLAGGIAGLAGLLIAPITPMAYDAGFVVGLKGFVAAVIGGLASYPMAAMGALAVGVIEALSSFWASAYSGAIVFALLIPALGWLSLRAPAEET